MGSGEGDSCLPRPEPSPGPGTAWGQVAGAGGPWGEGPLPSHAPDTRERAGAGGWHRRVACGETEAEPAGTFPHPRSQGCPARMPALPRLGPCGSASVSPQWGRPRSSLHPSSAAPALRRGLSGACREAAASPETPQTRGTPGPPGMQPLPAAQLPLPPRRSPPLASPFHFIIAINVAIKVAGIGARGDRFS